MRWGILIKNVQIRKGVDKSHPARGQRGTEELERRGGGFSWKKMGQMSDTRGGNCT